jgi:hypothetical protein
VIIVILEPINAPGLPATIAILEPINAPAVRQIEAEKSLAIQVLSERKGVTV